MVGSESSPVVATITVLDKTHVVGGDTVTTTKVVSYPVRVKGWLCDDCAGNYHTVEHTRKDGSIERVPIVTTDPKPGLQGQNLRSGREFVIRTEADHTATDNLTPRLCGRCGGPTRFDWCHTCSQ